MHTFIIIALALFLSLIVIGIVIYKNKSSVSYPLLLGASTDAEENIIGDYSSAYIYPNHLNFDTALSMAKSKNAKYMMLGGGYTWSFNILNPIKNPNLFISSAGISSFNRNVSNSLNCWVDSSATHYCGCGDGSGDDCPNTPLIPTQPTHLNQRRVWVIYQLF